MMIKLNKKANRHMKGFTIMQNISLITRFDPPPEFGLE